MACGGQACDGCSPCGSSSQQVPPSSFTMCCCKCRELPAQILANQTEPLCASCLHSSLFSKFKTALHTNHLILPTDKVLLAFSGGPASRVALEFLLELRQKAQRDASFGSVLAFGLGVVYVDESASLPFAPFDFRMATEEVQAVVLNGKQKPDEFLVVPLEKVYIDIELEDVEDGLNSRRRKLLLLLQHVTDPTGKEDLLEHLRMQALQQVAKLHGYTKLVVGLSTSRIAAKVISATAKGRGFSLPADIQYFDARWDIPVLMPLRDCVVKELVLLCHLRHLKTVFIPTFSTLSMSQHSINSLSDAFVSLLQEDNPARERTIMRTAAKLQPFFFNRLSSNGTSIFSARSNRSLKSPHGTYCSEEEVLEPLCSVCSAPLNENEILGMLPPTHVFEPRVIQTKNTESCTVASDTVGLAAPSPAPSLIGTCSSCQFQILGESKGNKTWDLLPELMKKGRLHSFREKEIWMRAQISEFLISEDTITACDN